MKLKIDDASVNVEHGIPVDDIQDVIDKVVDGGIVLIGAWALAKIITSQFN